MKGRLLVRCMTRTLEILNDELPTSFVGLLSKRVMRRCLLRILRMIRDRLRVGLIIILN